MTRTPPPTRAKGISGLVLLFCVTALAAGLAFDFATARSAWWLGAEQGAAAIIGVAAVVLVVLAGHLMRFVLRGRQHSEEGERDAGRHA